MHVVDDESSPSDALFFLTYDGAFVTASASATGDQRPVLAVRLRIRSGDRDWNGGQWVTVTAEVTDLDAFNANGAHTSEIDVRDADCVTITKGNALSGGPPAYFVCPLNATA